MLDDDRSVTGSPGNSVGADQLDGLGGSVHVFADQFERLLRRSANLEGESIKVNWARAETVVIQSKSSQEERTKLVGKVGRLVG